MQWTAHRVLLVSVLVVFAGCSTLSGGSGPTTVTPRAVPADESMATVTPGVGGGGGACWTDVTDLGFGSVPELASAHASALRESSFTVERSVSGSYGNGSLAYYNVTTVRVGADRTRVRWFELGMAEPGSRSPYRLQRWTDGERVASRELSGPSAAYEFRSVPNASTTTDRSRPAIARAVGVAEAVFANATTCVTGQVSDGGDTHAIVAFSRSAPPYRVPVGSELVGAVTGRAHVSSSGLVFDLRWRYVERSADGVVVRHSFRVSITRVGSTTVTRPSWYETAVERAATDESPDG